MGAQALGLAMRLEDLLADLERARRSGNGYVALCPAHDDRHYSLSVRQSNDRILLHCFAGCSFDAIRKALAIPTNRVDSNRSPGANSYSQLNSHWSEAERIKYARRIWQNSRPAAGTVAERYLRSRAITSPVPRALRFIPSLLHRESGCIFPALCAGIQDVNGNFIGVSITYLRFDGSGKAPVEPERKTHGILRGNAVRLSSQVGNQLCIGEGIETMLSILQATGIPSWAALGASNLPHVRLPDCIREVIICADPDPAGEAAAQRLAERLTREGRIAKIARTGRPGVDFNDLRL